MSPFERFGTVLTRVATLPSIGRTRLEDSRRFAAHGGPVDELASRVAEAAARLESVAARLEARL